MPTALLVLVLATQWRTIELDVFNRSNAWLESQGFDWARTETFNRGRSVLLTGQPQTQADVDAAVAGLLTITGVHSVTLSREVRPPLQAPKLKISFGDSEIKLTGVLANQAEIDQLRDHISNVFPTEKLIINELKLDPAIDVLPPLEWLFSTVFTFRDNISKLALALQQGELSIQGVTSSESSFQSIEARLRSQFEGSLRNQLSVEVKKATCQQQINGLLANQKIGFNVASAEISRSSHTLLDKLVAAASRCPSAQFEVIGHTDSNGSLASNLALSHNRAEAVVNYLTERGLNKRRFSSRGVGPNEPLSDNTTPEARAKNRRIELRLIN